MVRFVNKRTGEIKEAYKIEKKVHIQFEEGGKEYFYDEKNIEILENEIVENSIPDLKTTSESPFKVYSMMRICHTCREKTETLTYAKYDDGTEEDLIYPWDKKRLNNNKTFENEMHHMAYSGIENYPIKVFGSDEELDNMMLQMFPKRISSGDLVNICQHCGAKQRSSYIYKKMNRIIKDMEPLPLFEIKPDGLNKEKEYRYNEKNIDILDNKSTESKLLEADNGDSIRIYSVKRKCHSAKCKKTTEILTYIKFDDGSNEDLVFPWNKERLNKKKTLEDEMNHMKDPSIEYYPINVIGNDDELDKKLLKMFPRRIHMEYSYTQKRKYPMNICQHCGAKQGEYFVYKRVNQIIAEMNPLPVYKMIDGVADG